MKNIPLVLVGAFVLVPVWPSLVSNGYAADSAWGQAQGVEDRSKEAAAAAGRGQYGTAREKSGQGIDTPDRTPPPVDLRDKTGVVDPGTLKGSDPELPSLHIRPPPPLQ